MNQKQYDNNDKLFDLNNRAIGSLLNKIRRYVSEYGSDLLISEIIVCDYLCASIQSTFFFFKEIKVNHNLTDTDFLEKDLTSILKAYSKEIAYLKVKTVTEKEMTIFMNLMSNDKFLKGIKYDNEYNIKGFKKLMYHYCVLSDKIVNF